MKNRISALLLAFLLMAFLLPVSVHPRAAETVTNPFSDVKEDDRFYDAILWAYSTGVTAGKTDSTFLPGGHCTRAQAVTFLWRAAGCPKPVSGDNPFSDVSTGSYYFSAVMWAVEKGITLGKTATTFAPDDPVQRKQFVTFLWRAAGEPEIQSGSPFSDVPESDAYYYRAVVWACENGITAGTGNGLFGVNNTCTRAQTVMFLYRYCENKPATAPCGILLNASRLLTVSEPVQLTAQVLPFCADPSAVTWSSNDTAIATVSHSGLITPVGTGNAVITAKCGSVTAHCRVSCQMRPQEDAGLIQDSLLQNAQIDAVKKLLGSAPEGSTILGAYLSEKGYLSSVTGMPRYYVVSYPVNAGVTYRLYGKDVLLNTAAASLAVFSKSNIPGSGGRGSYDSIIIGCDQYDLSAATDYDIPFTPASDGFLLVAHCAGSNNGLDVEVVGKKSVNKPAVTVQIFGDSMSDNTWGDKRTWVDLLPGLLPEYDLTIRNRAIAGNTLTDFVRPDGTSGGVAHQILSDPSQLDPEADLIIVWAGSNDWTSIFSLGSMLDGDSTTVYGATQNIIEYVSRHSDAQLLFITPLQRNSTTDQQHRTETDMYGNRLNKRCYTLEQFSEAIRETCAYYDVPCLDLYHTSSINRDNIMGKYSEDGLHVNEAGEKLLAAQIVGMILHPASAAAPEAPIPAYDLSGYTDEFRNALFEPIVADGNRVWLNKNHAGIRDAFSKGPVKLSYKLEIGGQLITVESVCTASYSKERDIWYFADTVQYKNSTIRVTMEFGAYGMEAQAFTL